MRPYVLAGITVHLECLNHWKGTNLPSYGFLVALVKKDTACLMESRGTLREVVSRASSYG